MADFSNLRSAAIRAARLLRRAEKRAGTPKAVRLLKTRALKVKALTEKVPGSRYDQTVYFHGQAFPPPTEYRDYFGKISGQASRAKGGYSDPFGMFLTPDARTSEYYATRPTGMGLVYRGQVRYNKPLNLDKFSHYDRLNIVRSLRLTKDILKKWSKKHGSFAGKQNISTMISKAGQEAKDWVGKEGQLLVERKNPDAIRQKLNTSLMLLPRGVLHRAGYDAVQMGNAATEIGEISLPHTVGPIGRGSLKRKLYRLLPAKKGLPNPQWKMRPISMQ